ncbi:MAG: J domain-containing protein [Gaiellales bacterium]
MANRRDYYEVLGVSRDAGEGELKTAFRRLAREHHPDVSQAPDAEERFRELAEAYEVLSKSETRELYDQFGHEGLRKGGFRPSGADIGDLSDLISTFFGGDVFGDLFGGTRRPMRGADAAAQVELDLAEASTGVRREVLYSVVETCTLCNGTGAEPGSELIECGTCNGTGRLQTVASSLLGQVVRTMVCARCKGGGRIVTERCTTCRGEGSVRNEKKIAVDIPPGIHDGQRIRLATLGHSEITGQGPGDLFVHVSVREDDRFHRDGNDLISRLDITMTDAALGVTVPVPTLDGETEIELASGTQPGVVVTLRGKGMPRLQGRGRGDHRIVVNVRIPRRLSEEQRQALEEFDESVDEHAYAEEEGFFDRLKAAFR